MPIIGSHQQAQFTIPVNNTSPVNADEVRLNDNATVTQYNAHDADATIHVQSSAIGSRPVPGTAGRIWATTDTGEYRWWYDDGSAWHEMGADHINFPVKATQTLVKGDVVKATGFNVGLGVTEVAKVSSATDVALGVARDDIANGATGYVTNTGVIRNINTVAFNAGDLLYPNTTGGFTASKPASGLYQALAYVLRAHASNGVILVEASEPQYVQSASDTPNTAVIRNGSGNFAGNEITATTRFIGALTGNVTGNVTGNAGTATALSSARTFALTGDVSGSVSSDLSSGASISTTLATVPVSKGGTGLTSAPSNGQLPIGNGTGYTLKTLTAGNNITVTNTSGDIRLDVVGLASGVSGAGTTDTLPRFTGGGTSSQLADSAVKDNGSKVSLERAQLRLNTVDYTVPTAQGAANTCLTNDGSGNLSWVTTAQPLDQQTFNSSGTWTKPALGSMALVECWGAGGSGSNDSTTAGRNGGGGGGYMFVLMKLSDLGATETATVGAGGSARTTAANGIAGGNSSLGSHCTAYGGSGGRTSGLPVGGGSNYRIGTEITDWTAVSLANMDFFQGPFVGGVAPGSTIGISVHAVYDRYRNAIYGGGAGASRNDGGTVTAGTSVYGGAGGAEGVAGTQPAGGGGRGSGTGGGTSGAGGAGRVRVTVW
jgi:hypothetical protein